jgi:radical SAM protein with 4Fe4S-binding SPASM domain
MDTDIKPSRIYIDVTNECPLRCLHCCTESGSPWDDELSLSEINQLVDQIYEMQVNNVIFSGGEPMIRADLPAILEHAHAKGLNITLLTSGILIDDEWAKYLARLKIRVKVSLDGVTPQTHDFLRGNGAYQMLLQALKRLRITGIENLSVHFTIHRRNLRELTKLPELLPKLGVKNLIVSMVKPAGRAKLNSELLIPPAMVPYVRQNIEILKKSEDITIQQFSDKGWAGFGCPATCNKFGVTATGYTTPCAFFGPEFLGKNIREYSLKDLWEHHIAQGSMFIVNEQCAQCPNLPISGGGCRARALYFHKDINGTDPYCCALHQQAVFLEKYIGMVEDDLATV